LNGFFTFLQIKESMRFLTKSTETEVQLTEEHCRDLSYLLNEIKTIVVRSIDLEIISFKCTKECF